MFHHFPAQSIESTRQELYEERRRAMDNAETAAMKIRLLEAEVALLKQSCAAQNLRIAPDVGGEVAYLRQQVSLLNAVVAGVASQTYRAFQEPERDSSRTNADVVSGLACSVHIKNRINIVPAQEQGESPAVPSRAHSQPTYYSYGPEASQRGQEYNNDQCAGIGSQTTIGGSRGKPETPSHFIPQPMVHATGDVLAGQEGAANTQVTHQIIVNKDIKRVASLGSTEDENNGITTQATTYNMIRRRKLELAMLMEMFRHVGVLRLWIFLPISCVSLRLDPLAITDYLRLSSRLRT